MLNCKGIVKFASFERNMKKLLIAALLLFSANSDVLAQKGKSYSSGGSKTPSYSGKSYSPPVKSSPPPVIRSSPPPAQSVKPNSPQSIKPNSNSGWNNKLTDSGKSQESKSNYDVAKGRSSSIPATPAKPSPTPKSSYTNSAGVEKKIEHDSPAVTSIRKTTTINNYHNYDSRASVFYGNSYYHPQPYNDYFSPFIMGWILSDALNSHQRALWVYHHRDSGNSDYNISDERYAELLRKDATLQAELDKIKAQNISKDPSYVPPQLGEENTDLMYDKKFVDGAYNPTDDEPSVTWHGFLMFLKWTAIIIVFFVLILFLFWLFFIEEFN